MPQSLTEQSGKPSLVNINDQFNALSEVLRTAYENLDAVVNGNAVTETPRNEVSPEAFINLEVLDTKIKNIKAQAIGIRDMIFQLRG
ncbi:MAG TPA: hypothetical protein ENI23_08915 [bacterium]|nr:hypothetical protein [bacterium]